MEVLGLQLVAKHIGKVQENMDRAIANLTVRAAHHDESKYSPEELGLVVAKPSLDATEHGSAEEKAILQGLKKSLEHHYDNNSHHPEYYWFASCGACFKDYPRERAWSKCDDCGYDIFKQDGEVDSMTLLDLIEMVCDWKAAGDMSEGGSFAGSVEYGTERFRLSPQLVSILKNTGKELGWME